MNDKLLNPVNGSLQFSDHFWVSPGTTPEMLQAYFKAAEIKINAFNNGWAHYKLRNIQVDDKYFIFTFLFENHRLKIIWMVVSDKPFKEEGWDNWSLENELKEQKMYDQWLTSQVGNLRKFNWGTVNAVFDERGGSSFIALHYQT